MDAKKATVLILTFCLAIGIGGCNQPSKGDRTSADADKGHDAEPAWTISWSQLQIGMDAVEVLSLLDEPRHIKVTKINTTWYYSDRRADGPYVIFDTRAMRVDRWRAPEGR